MGKGQRRGRVHKGLKNTGEGVHVSEDLEILWMSAHSTVTLGQKKTELSYLALQSREGLQADTGACTQAQGKLREKQMGKWVWGSISFFLLSGIWHYSVEGI